MYPNKLRIHSVDILRGVVMIIMALDHVRDFFHAQAMVQDPTDMATTTPVVFFTRWITHFCAPVFVFLSGISACIAGERKTKKELSNFLIKRGLWLVLAEIVVITFALSFDPLYNIIFLQVIWAIGFSMIILGLMVRNRVSVIIALGCQLYFGHNIFDYIRLPDVGIGNHLLKIFIADPRAFIPLGAGRLLITFYTALPWTGVMLLGYAFGYLYHSTADVGKRKKIL